MVLIMLAALAPKEPARGPTEALVATAEPTPTEGAVTAHADPKLYVSVSPANYVPGIPNLITIQSHDKYPVTIIRLEVWGHSNSGELDFEGNPWPVIHNVSVNRTLNHRGDTVSVSWPAEVERVPELEAEAGTSGAAVHVFTNRGMFVPDRSD